MNLDELLRSAVKAGASDLHLKAGAVPYIRVSGDLSPLPSSDELRHEETELLAAQVLDSRQKRLLSERNELDVGHEVPGVGRFRINIFRQRGALSLACRVIPDAIPPIAELNLPPVLEQLCEENRGLILVSGTTGSGKSTTLASMIDRMNRTRVLHMLTIEDPI